MSTNYQEKYKVLKRKLKILVYEHEGLSQELEKSQRKLLKVARDNSFLLDRLLQYEQVTVDSPPDSDATVSSDNESEIPPPQKKRAVQPQVSNVTVKTENIETTVKVEPEVELQDGVVAAAAMGVTRTEEVVKVEPEDINTTGILDADSQTSSIIAKDNMQEAEENNT